MGKKKFQIKVCFWVTLLKKRSGTRQACMCAVTDCLGGNQNVLHKRPANTIARPGSRVPAILCAIFTQTNPCGFLPCSWRTTPLHSGSLYAYFCKSWTPAERGVWPVELSEKEKPLLGFLHQVKGVQWPCEVFSYMDPEEFHIIHPLSTSLLFV